VAPGGRLAVTFIQETKPRAVLAVACAKELVDGVEGVQKQAEAAGMNAPSIVVVPLLKDGCVNTEVDVPKALELLGEGVD